MHQQYPAPDYASMNNGCIEGQFVYPKCHICGEEIRDKHYYLISNENVCVACVNENFRMKTEDYPQW